MPLWGVGVTGQTGGVGVRAVSYKRLLLLGIVCVRRRDLCPPWSGMFVWATNEWTRGGKALWLDKAVVSVASISV